MQLQNFNYRKDSNYMVPATFIAIEGPDRVGKQTQARLLYNNLKNLGWKVKTVEVPVKTKITHPLIYWMLRNGSAKRMPKLFQFFQFLNKFFWQLFVCPFLSFKYDYVILDRWAASSIVYGQASGIKNKTFLYFLYNRLFKPDVTLVLNGKSFEHNTVKDSYEKDDEFQDLVRHYYKRFIADSNELNGVEETRSRVIEINSEKDKNTLSKIILQKIEYLL